MYIIKLELSCYLIVFMFNRPESIDKTISGRKLKTSMQENFILRQQYIGYVSDISNFSQRNVTNDMSVKLTADSAIDSHAPLNS